jgi:hypothetical protein
MDKIPLLILTHIQIHEPNHTIIVKLELMQTLVE